MKKLNNRQKHEVYLLTLDALGGQYERGHYMFMCNELHRAIGIKHSRYSSIDDPNDRLIAAGMYDEFMALKPARTATPNVWFNPRDYESRRTIITQLANNVAPSGPQTPFKRILTAVNRIIRSVIIFIIIQ